MSFRIIKIFKAMNIRSEHFNLFFYINNNFFDPKDPIENFDVNYPFNGSVLNSKYHHEKVECNEGFNSKN